MMNLNEKDFVRVSGWKTMPFLSDKKESAMKQFLLGFAEGYFIVSLIIYIATYLILKNPINTLFYPEIYPVLFGLFYLGYKVNKKQVGWAVKNDLLVCSENG